MHQDRDRDARRDRQSLAVGYSGRIALPSRYDGPGTGSECFPPRASLGLARPLLREVAQRPESERAAWSAVTG